MDTPFPSHKSSSKGKTISATYKLGKWAALLIVVLSIVYIFTGVLWFVSETDPVSRSHLQPTEPYITILRIILLITIPLIVVLFAAIYTYASPNKKGFALTAFGFSVLMSLLTSSVHYLMLTFIPQSKPEDIQVLAPLFSRNWPSVTMALDMLAWGPFLGLALLFAAPVFKGGRLELTIRLTMQISGSLCFADLVCPVTGNMKFCFLGIAGYAFVFPLACVFLALLFARLNIHR